MIHHLASFHFKIRATAHTSLARLFQSFIFVFAISLLSLTGCKGYEIDSPIINELAKLTDQNQNNDQSLSDENTPATQPQSLDPLQPRPIVLGLEHWAGAAPWIIAEHRGIFEAHGVKPRLFFFEQPALLMRAIETAQVDAGIVTLSDFARMSIDNPRMRLLFMMQKSMSADVIFAKKEIKHVNQLKGKRVAYTLDSPGDLMLSDLLKGLRIQRDEILPILATPDAVATRYQAGDVDAVILRQPFLPKPVQQTTDLPSPNKDFHIIFKASQLPNRLQYTLAASDAKLSSHEEALRGLLSAWLDAVDYMHKHPEDSAKILTDVWRIEESVAEQAIQSVKYFSLGDNQLRYTRITPALLNLRLREIAASQDIQLPKPESLMSNALFRKSSKKSQQPTLNTPTSDQ